MSAYLINRVTMMALLVAVSAAAFAESCMVPPTQKEQVSGRFGKMREGGAKNFGSGNSKAHMHDGLDFSTSGVAAPIMATTDGTVVWAKQRGSAGNTVMIKRSNGEIATYYHLSSIGVREGDVVKAGQQIGASGNTGMQATGAVHLHFIYGVPNGSDARAKAFSVDAAKNPAFNPAQLPNAISSRDFGYATDPSPYFCKSFPIKDDGLHEILGSDTKTQYAKLFGETPPMGVSPSTQFDPVQVAAANGDALQAAARGIGGNVASVLSEADGFGSLPTPPIGNYETMSPAEMLTTEAKRRFSDSEWNTNIVKVSSRALWVDYLRAVGVALYMNEAIRLKKERVEGLLALHTSQRLEKIKARVANAQQQAERASVMQKIN